MRTRTKRLFRIALVSLTLGAAAIVSPRDARAEADTFGTGNGHSGAYVSAAPDEVINAYAPVTADAAVGATSVAIGTALGAATGFAVGDLVMVWRATGLAGGNAADAPSSAPGSRPPTVASSSVPSSRRAASSAARTPSSRPRAHRSKA